MSSIAIKCFVFFACLSCFGLPSAAGKAQPTLSCSRDVAESAALRQAPSGARRAGPHLLKVVSQKGTKRFRDEPPHDEGGMAGVHWRYCGYDPTNKVHLVEKTDDGLFTGQILLDENGKLLPAGHTILFSADGMKFLAIEQESGVDGESWAVYEKGGKVIWSGYAGATSKARGAEVVVSTFDRPEWNRNGELTARFVCTSSKAIGRAVLTRLRTGVWGWQADVQCRVK